MEEKGDACRAVDGKHEEERPFGKTWAQMGENIEKDLEETGWESVNWVCLVQDMDK